MEAKYVAIHFLWQGRGPAGGFTPSWGLLMLAATFRHLVAERFFFFSSLLAAIIPFPPWLNSTPLGSTSSSLVCYSLHAADWPGGENTSGGFSRDLAATQVAPYRVESLEKNMCASCVCVCMFTVKKKLKGIQRPPPSISRTCKSLSPWARVTAASDSRSAISNPNMVPTPPLVSSFLLVLYRLVDLSLFFFSPSRSEVTLVRCEWCLAAAASPVPSSSPSRRQEPV